MNDNTSIDDEDLIELWVYYLADLIRNHIG
jgi:hypothetical protein